MHVNPMLFVMPPPVIGMVLCRLAPFCAVDKQTSGKW